MSDEKKPDTGAPLLAIASLAMALPDMKGKDERTTAALGILGASAELGGVALNAYQHLARAQHDRAATMVELIDVERGRSTPDSPVENDERPELGEWLLLICQRGDDSVEHLGSHLAAPSTLQALIRSLSSLLDIVPTDRRNRLQTQVEDWQAALDGWRAKQPDAEPDKAAE